MQGKSFRKGCLITVVVFAAVTALIFFVLAFVGEVPVKKPNIYIYPEKTENITVKVSPRGAITKSIPKYKNGWTVSVEPDGKIDGQFNYLFYEANVKYPFTLNKGWIVNKSDFSSQMNVILRDIGLQANEIEDFICYWSKELKWDKDKYAVYLISQQEINKAIPLAISKTPDSLLRVYFYFKATDKDFIIERPSINTFERKGFTVVEWGGIGQ
ncbi:MAG: hypothetical protein AWM53_01463 [Candidatus Dichloromethanomonas elyunquensis]|nr:MAG: hypothetical protein AWM53_01463 [Candidatus Dichloromethanomonas elyunquensis]